MEFSSMAQFVKKRAGRQAIARDNLGLPVKPPLCRIKLELVAAKKTTRFKKRADAPR
jgi:hypothetical protein